MVKLTSGIDAVKAAEFIAARVTISTHYKRMEPRKRPWR
jgi:hypothetical protein